MCKKLDGVKFTKQRAELLISGTLAAALLVLYPLRLVVWAHKNRKPSRWAPLRIPALFSSSVSTAFEPAPILYPPVLPIFVSLLIATNVQGIVLPTLILCIAAIPKALIPSAQTLEVYSPVHWLLSCVPLLTSDLAPSSQTTGDSPSIALSGEVLVLLYPLHQTLCLILHHLTTTSLLPAELQLLSISLINLLILAASPQALILKALLWIGGLGVTIFCGPVIKWGITLARVPNWRFRKITESTKRQSLWRSVLSLLPLKKANIDLLGALAGDSSDLTEDADTDEDDASVRPFSRCKSTLPYMDGEQNRKNLGSSHSRTRDSQLRDESSQERNPMEGAYESLADIANGLESLSRRHTLPVGGIQATKRSKTHTASGRRRRAASTSVRPFFSLTRGQATLRKWMYAGWVYVSIVAVIFIGIRGYVQHFVLDGNEPVGWALGYLFGDLHPFRFQVVSHNLERWICLPPRSGVSDEQSCHLGWIEHLRYSSFGEANTRLIVAAYWAGVIIIGLAVVQTLSPIYAVDTRRKVFHFMMVAMLLPATYVDPTWCALALSLVLAIFLLADLLRASQLPPLSKLIASFLEPFCDGRDNCGPVVVSHIFLLIGCAIPLWLSLASLPRTGSAYLTGWEVPTREVSMVAGVVCVGLGDAAASLIGRRFGYHKWLWGGGKSLEGSVAFVAAVFIGLMAANIWLHIGGWPITTATTSTEVLGVGAIWSSLWNYNWSLTIMNTGICATTASLTEAVLTGGNDNVVVPVVLWTCVKGLGI